MSASTTEFAKPATEDALNELADRLRQRNYEVLVVDNAAEAKAAALERVPDGAEVYSGKSKTLEDAGIFQELMDSGRYNFVRKRLMKMDRATQGDEMRKMTASPDYIIGSVQAVTDAGQRLVASASGSQIGPLSAGARTVILVIGSQKIVPNLDEGLRRITEHVMPYEDKRLREQMGIGTKLTRVLILQGDFMPGRTTVILVRDPIGV
ncbi:MAG TPA: LUD domain-containing protein [Candidatus Dormibacteraeota bacterium]|nr:LUD domain-containing protein [Candidatus Dormibacteraeota bacterium]